MSGDEGGGLEEEIEGVGGRLEGRERAREGREM